MLEFRTTTANDKTTLASSSVFLKPSFRLALAKEFRLQAITINLLVDNKPICIPAYKKNHVMGTQLIIGAGFDSTGYFSIPDDLPFHKIIGVLSEQLQTTAVDQLEVRTQNPIACLTDHSDKYELRIRVNTPCAERLMTFSKSTRRNIRLPFKQGFHFDIDNSLSHLEIFYALYLKNMHELGSLPHSWQFFVDLWETCRDDFSLFVGYLNKEPVVSSLIFLSEDEVYGAWSGTHPAYKKSNVFLGMLWSIMEFCEQTGRSCYNLGRSSEHSGSFQFKERLANEKSKIYYYQIDTRQPTTTRSPVYKAASWFIRNTPPVVMNTLSHHLLHRFY